MNNLLQTILFAISFCLVFISIQFKIQHWPYGKELMLFSHINIMVLYVIRFLFKKQRGIIDYIKLLLFVCWGTNSILATLHLPYLLSIFPAAILLVLCWIVLEVFSAIQNKEVKKISNILFIGAILLISFGIFLYIIHYPGALIILLAGLLIGAVWAIKESI